MFQYFLIHNTPLLSPSRRLYEPEANTPKTRHILPEFYNPPVVNIRAVSSDHGLLLL